MSLKKIREFLSEKNCSVQGIAGNSMDFKTIYVKNNETGYTWNFGGCDYRQAYKNLLHKNSSEVYK